jgi:lysophospholipase L1-like esterase
MSGWGAHLAAYVDGPVRNLAFGGATTETFADSGSWRLLLSEIEPGDTVIVQFGHNDQKQPHLDSRGGYSARLRGMVADAQHRGARVVLCTSVERRWFEGTRVTPTHGDYPNAVRDLAHELDVGLIDLTAFTTWLYEDMGPDASRGLLSHFAAGEHPLWPEGLADDTHFHERGAERIAAFVGASLRGIERKGGDQPAKGSVGVS